MLIYPDAIQTMKEAAPKPIVAASGYFDPIHIGHIEYLEKAKALGSTLVVIVNAKHQAMLKKGFEFMDENERIKIVDSLRCVDYVIGAVDTDGTVCKTLELVAPDIFAKGGDRFSGEIPESVICRKLGIKIVDGLGGKIQSSSDLTVNKKEILDILYHFTLPYKHPTLAQCQQASDLYRKLCGD